MARRRRTTDDDVSLFPFLSIIACVIGVLTMMIATLSLAQTDTPDVALVEKYEQKQKQLVQTEQRLEQIKREIAVSNSAVLELREEKQLLDMTLAQLQELLAELERIEKELAEQQQVKIVIPPIDAKARETVADMQAEFDALREQLAQLEKEISQRKSDAEANVTVLPQGTGLNFKPHFVECAPGAIVLHDGPSPKRIRAANMAKDADFIKLLEQVANGKDDSIVFLLRSDGLGTYRACKQLCDEREIRNGKIPVAGKGLIDLSAFTTPKN